MSNSNLVSYTQLSPNHSGARTHAIDRITPHCVVGQLSAEGIAGCFRLPSRKASCNYGIGTDGRVCLVVDEGNRSWCSSNEPNDQRAVTIECASGTIAPYYMNDKVYQSLITLCVDICRRNGKKKLLWFGDKTKTLAYVPAPDEMVITVHRWFKNKSCPGDWLFNRLGDVAAQVTSILQGEGVKTKIYRVQTGAFRVKTNADALAKRLQQLKFDTYVVKIDNLYKVQCGAFSKRENAENLKERLKLHGYQAFIVCY